jgi:hypothetical protein
MEHYKECSISPMPLISQIFKREFAFSCSTSFHCGHVVGVSHRDVSLRVQMLILMDNMKLFSNLSVKFACATTRTAWEILSLFAVVSDGILDDCGPMIKLYNLFLPMRQYLRETL